jgi:hypothetical protein
MRRYKAPWRVMQSGEQIYDGDEYFQDCEDYPSDVHYSEPVSRIWYPCYTTVGHNVGETDLVPAKFRTRRRAGVPPVVAPWRLVEVGECLETGDMVCVANTHRWMRVTLAEPCAALPVQPSDTKVYPYGYYRTKRPLPSAKKLPRPPGYELVALAAAHTKAEYLAKELGQLLLKAQKRAAPSKDVDPDDDFFVQLKGGRR